MSATAASHIKVLSGLLGLVAIKKIKMLRSALENLQAHPQHRQCYCLTGTILILYKARGVIFELWVSHRVIHRLVSEHNKAFLIPCFVFQPVQ